MIYLGSHVAMSGKEMFLGSVKEALSYGSNTFMVYTGAPQNSKRRPLDELRIPEAKELMKESGIDRFIVHAPYLINLGNSVNEETFKLGKEMLAVELDRAHEMGSDIMVLHPGSAVGAEPQAGIAKIIEGLDEVIKTTENGLIALETMAGKGSELGRSFDELKDIFDGVKDNSRLRICIDTCHLNDAGYDVVNNFDGILNELDSKIGIGRIACVHINDSLNPLGAHKDRHANIGKGTIGLEALRYVVHHEKLEGLPMCLETPHIKDPLNPKEGYAPYKEEIAMLR
ncbi:MAG: deoxyribonuclease IV [Lachnospiraceae bacterium]|nr:deoxyribonuclease IV [Lachnospiraceae bacterium]